MTTIFDLETVPLPIGELTAALPPFDPEAVKLGNLKDPEKIKAKLADAESNHARDFIDNAALNPLTGRIKIAAFRYNRANEWHDLVYAWEEDAQKRAAVEAGGMNESYTEVLNVFEDYRNFLAAILMKLCQPFGEPDGKIIGYEIHNFDLPYLFQAAWMAGVPASLDRFRRGRYWRDNVIDIRDRFNFGDRFAGHGGLDGLCKLLKTKTRKTGDGKQFGRLYENDPAAAICYAINDTHATEECARAMGEI